MATVHPSRMGLVPQDPKDVYPDRRRARSPSPPHRHDRDRREGVKEREKERARDRDRESDDDSERGRGGGRERVRQDDRRDRRRDRDDERMSPRRRDSPRQADDRDRDRDRSRRASPEYGDYKRPPSPSPAAPSMYPNRQSRDGMYERRGGYGGGSEYLERCVALPLFPGGFVLTCFFIAGGSSEKAQRSASGHLHQKLPHAHCTWLFHALLFP